MSGKKQPPSFTLDEGMIRDRVTGRIVYASPLWICYSIVFYSLFCIYMWNGNSKVFSPSDCYEHWIRDTENTAQPTATT